MDRKKREEKRSGVERMKDALYSRAAPPQADPAARTPLPHDREHTPHGWEDIHAPVSNQVQSFEENVGAVETADVLQQDRTLPESIAKKMALNRTTDATFRSNFPAEVMPLVAKPKKVRTNHMALYFLGLAVMFFLAALGVAAFLFFQGTNTISAQNIDLAIVAPSLTDSGKPVVIQYLITNRNQETLRLSDLIITYPPGTRMASNMTQELPQERLKVGDVPPGGQVIKTASAVFFGTEGTSQKIAGKLEYRLKGSNAIFTKQSETNFIIGSSPVSISTDAPDEAISGQAFNFDITVTSNSTASLKNVALQAQLPFGFSLGNADPSPDAGGTLWRLGDFEPGTSKTIRLTGTLTGADGDTRVFHFLAGSESDLSQTKLSVPLLTSPLTIVVRKPFISAVMSVERKTGSTVAVPLGSGVSGEIAWENNLPEDASHIEFVLSLSGAPLDPNSISTNGFYDSSKSRIVWSEQTDSALAVVQPGGHGTLQFSFKSLPPSAKLLSNPYIDLALTVTAVRAGQGRVPETVTSVAKMKVQLASAVTLSALATHFVGAFENTGPMPPVHSQATTYTVLWSVKNSSNDIGNGAVKATLPPYMQFVAAAPGSEITYDAPSRTVTWILGNIAIGAGYGTPARTASFQVNMTPSVTQTGQIPTLTSEATFTGADRYAGTAITTTVVAPTTRLTDDPQFVQGMEMVK